MRTPLLALLLAACAGAPTRPAPVPKPLAAKDGAVYHIKEIELPTPKAGPSIVAVAPDGALFVALARAGKIARMAPDGALHEFVLPQGSFPVGVTVDPKGQVWFSDIRRNCIVRLDPADGALHDFAVPSRDAWPFQLVRTAEGIFYFTERVGNRIGRLDPVSGEVREIEVPTKNAQPAGLTATPDGQIFFTENSGNRIGHLDPATDRLEEIVLPTPSTPGPFYGPAGMTSDKHGNVWFAELDGRLGLVRAERRDRVEEIPLPNPKVRPGGVAVDGLGVVWFTGLDGNCIGSFDPESGRFSEYPLPSGQADPRPLSPPEATARGEMPRAGQQAKSTRPFGIVVSGGKIWISEQYGHRLGVLDPPKLELTSPSNVVSTPTVPVRALNRIGDQQVELQLDGRSVAGKDLDAALLAPGPHHLAATSGEGADRYRSEIEFAVSSSWPMVEELVERLARDGSVAAELRRAVSDSAQAAALAMREGRLDEANAALASMIERLSPLSSALPSALLAHLRAFSYYGERVQEVRVSSSGCARAAIALQVGDSVRFVADGDNVELAAADGTLRSGALQNGQAFVRRFTREGTLTISCGQGTAVLEVRPRSPRMVEYPLPGPERVPTVLVLPPEGGLWLAAGGGGYANLARVPLNNRIVHFSDGKFTEYQTPTPESAPTSIKRAPDGTLWFTERVGNNIGRLDPKTGRVTELPLPTAMAGPTGIAVDKQGQVWFTEKKASKIGRLDPKSGTFTETPTPHPNAEPSTVVVDQSGHIWFDERGADNLVRLDPRTNELRQFRVPTKGSRVIGLVPDPRGYVWFLELAGHKIGRLDVQTGQVIELAIPTRLATPFKACLDHFGRLWFTEAFGNKIGVLQDETFYEFALPRKDSMPGGIEIDADGNVWFTEQVGNAVGMLPRAAAYLVSTTPSLAQQP